jgi:hypothetical protein
MTVTAYRNTATGISLVPSAFTVVVQLRVPNTGNFVVLGRITATNPTTTPQTINTEMTTLDGATVLDEALVTVPPGANANMVCVTLQGFLSPSSSGQNEIVDLRCSSNCTANSCSLIASSVDALSGSL